MKILALESSTQMASAAILENGVVVAEESSMRQRSHSEFLNAAVFRLLQSQSWLVSDVDAFAVGKGPGSFTGIRVASNVGKTFAYSFNKPLLTVDSLQNLALQTQTNLPILTIINAYKNLVYTGLYIWNHGKLEELRAPFVSDLPNLEKVLESYTQAVVVGDGYLAFSNFFSDSLKPKLVRLENSSDFPTATTLGIESDRLLKLNKTLEWISFSPLYLRASEAEENLNKKMESQHGRD